MLLPGRTTSALLPVGRERDRGGSLSAGRGNFWLAWAGDQPAGYVGAQDMGNYVELRRMYVRSEYRRHGIGAMLVRALIEHCKKQEASPVKLWTSEGGPGRYLYAKLGFRAVELSGDELGHIRTHDGEIRMLLELGE
ncbi:MAG: GNAT family N-acetyltransferase [candidate division NC10 bacterium]